MTDDHCDGCLQVKKLTCDSHVVLLGLLPRNGAEQCGRCDWDSHFQKATEAVNVRMAEYWADNDGVSLFPVCMRKDSNMRLAGA